MNPSVPPSFIDEAYETDAASAAAEYGAQFRSDIEAFVPRDAVEACVMEGRFELQPVANIKYVAFADPSGDSSGSMTIAHREGENAVLDAVREVKPPFSPEAVVGDFATLLKTYRIGTVTAIDTLVRDARLEQHRKACKGVPFVARTKWNREREQHQQLEWQGRQGSNLRQPVLETGTLPTELHPCGNQASPPIGPFQA
jgi:hypothetical protein